MNKLIILVIFMLLSCYKPTKEEIEISSSIKEEKLRIQDSLINKDYGIRFK